MAASLADGETILNNPAPNLRYKFNILLNSMGALIKVENSSKIVVKGVKFLKPGEVNVKPDRIEAAFLISGLASEVSPFWVQIFTSLIASKKLTLSGAKIYGGNDFLKIEYCGKLIAVDIETVLSKLSNRHSGSVHGLNAIAEGTSVMTENIFEKVSSCSELNRLGADIYTQGKKHLLKVLKI